MTATFSLCIAASESPDIICCSVVKARNTLYPTLIFTFVACPVWLEIWLVSWCLFLPEVWCYFCCDCCCWSELRRAVSIDRSGVVCLEKNICPAHLRIVTSGLLVRRNYCLARLQLPWLPGCNCSRFGTLMRFVSLGCHEGDVHSHTTGSEDAAYSTPTCGQNTDNCSIL
jgi:hypothetical protein